ncbi:type I glyceraldehyde-3-phosphate dehydrogenase [Natronobacterium gregoryi]|uniref:glyceraldehyde-3-phosphate dehydrogenase (NAD(P)(+)) (phosphorylating) n=2 Tax=Natronobacterium gregoryi TaxID=44930 RepID=L0AKQ3_NATGS|nr:type I glyceraldehyde-3-phosphate dehydrogenase [Natronobacterium gregoryi]AFZ74034.1 glyceraldehyde-3-phosphate dehydrogenase, type I [Natronobacterium gregoryi SP2]ELY70559.1 glyceraldehyde-3-phosphate dehydrogenase, type I [Natronobacterium gregoryi SP2]PLK20781.1 type I glyceraldehyde-3-phosphate dehydrogenase [Natronobacterium gregoryi SP2]SFJ07167.1 glyceraldehyde 3-phosphate dehydrogenase [Natronobacterium gregoryi]
MRLNPSSGGSGASETLRIGLNGFGRVGRCLLRASLTHDDVDIVAINDVMDDDDMAYLLQYDSVHGRLDDISRRGDVLSVGDQEFQLLSERDPSELPWDDFDVDIAFEATGLFRTHDEAAKHLEAGAKKVVISAPPKGETAVPMFIYGVNHEEYDDSADVVSNASCTTNSVAPVLQVLDEEFDVISGLLTTIHAYTGSQALVDGPLDKRRRGRAAAENIVPTTTGAAGATSEVLPEFEGKLEGMAMRVPVPNGSITDITVNIEDDVEREEVIDAIRAAADDELAGVLGYTDDEIVSRDIVGLPFASYVDLESLMVAANDTVKVLAWYDNEYGFSNQMIELAKHVASESERIDAGRTVVH